MPTVRICCLSSIAPFVVLTAACSSSPRPRDDAGPPADVRVATPAPGPTVVASAVASGGAPCARLREIQSRSQLAAIDAARRAGAGKEPSNDPLPDKDVAERLAKETAACKESGRGAWGLVVERVSPMPWDGWGGIRALLSLVHVDATGAVRRVTPFDDAPDGGLSAKDDNFYFSNVDGAEVKALETFDYDGDGEAEVMLVVAGRFHEGESWAWGRVYTATNGAVQAYPPAAGIPFSSIVDEDGDGRPDLLGGEPYDDVVENCCSGFSSELPGPPLLAHALSDGSFSRTDALAAAVARRSCPGRPREIVAGGATGWNVGAVHTAVACARLWGVEGTAILASIDKVFGVSTANRGTAASAPKAALECDMTLCISRQATRRSAEAWVAVTPPITLR